MGHKFMESKTSQLFYAKSNYVYKKSIVQFWWDNAIHDTPAMIIKLVILSTISQVISLIRQLFTVTNGTKTMIKMSMYFHKLKRYNNSTDINN